MSVRHIFGDGVFEFTNLIPYESPLTDVQMLLCPNLPGFTLHNFSANCGTALTSNQIVEGNGLF